MRRGGQVGAVNVRNADVRMILACRRGKAPRKEGSTRNGTPDVMEVEAAGRGADLKKDCSGNDRRKADLCSRTCRQRDGAAAACEYLRERCAEKVDAELSRWIQR
jgi:hypothetical protein